MYSSLVFSKVDMIFYSKLTIKLIVTYKCRSVCVHSDSSRH